MAALTWDTTGNRLYETGVSNCVLFPYNTTTKHYGKGVAWNGVTSITETPTGADEEAMYADNIKYLSLRAVEEFEASIEAYTYPDEFAECDGTVSPSAIPGLYFGQQTRKKFCLAYKTKVGNDEDFEDHNYKIHIIYNATASPSERAYKSINDSPESITFSWDMTTTPQPNSYGKDTANIIIDASKLHEESLFMIEAVLFGVTKKTVANGSGYLTLSQKPSAAYVLLPGEIMQAIESVLAGGSTKPKISYYDEDEETIVTTSPTLVA